MYIKNKPYFLKNNMNDVKIRELEDSNQDEHGYLNINIFRYVTRTPIEGAIVRVSKIALTGLYKENGSGTYLYTSKSGQDGNVPVFKLSVLNSEDEHYIVSVQAYDYHNAYLIDIPIYPDVTTTYDMYLRHYSIGSDPDYEFIMQPQIIR